MWKSRACWGSPPYSLPMPEGVQFFQMHSVTEDQPSCPRIAPRADPIQNSFSFPYVSYDNNLLPPLHKQHWQNLAIVLADSIVL